MGGTEAIENLFVTGINFKKADIASRGLFSLDREKKSIFLKAAKENGFQGLIILNTCNRCEIYGIGSVETAEKLLCEVTGQSYISLQDLKFTKRSTEAIEHIFKVAAGLDSMIIGDNEILGQFREACRESKHYNLLGAFFERMANTGIQTSKDIKTRTGISNGTMSVSFAAVQIIRERFANSNQNMMTLLIGTGQFGTKVAHNLKTYFPEIQLTVSNRNFQKAENLAQKIEVSCLLFDEIQKKAADFDIIIICVDSGERILNRAALEKSNKTLVLDLSVPRASDSSISTLPHAELLTLDDISMQLNNTLQTRMESQPVAEKMIQESIEEFSKWYRVFRHKDKIRQVKNALLEISDQCPYLSKLEKPQLDKILNKAMSELIQKLKGENFSQADIDQTISYFLKINHQAVEAHR
jgi:glutamyl-tRNA reductase